MICDVVQVNFGQWGPMCLLATKKKCSSELVCYRLLFMSGSNLLILLLFLFSCRMKLVLILPIGLVNSKMWVSDKFD